MSTHKAKHQKLLPQMLVIFGAIGVFAYGVISTMSEDLLWFLGGATVPDPERIVLRVNGQETLLTAGSPGYDLIIEGLKDAMSDFNNMSPRSAGLSEATLEDYQHHGTILELYFSQPVNFHLPFNDLRPNALLIPIEGLHAGRGYVFRGKDGKWLAGQMLMSDPQPLLDALSTLGYIR
jgi:hypothetical protein